MRAARAVRKEGRRGRTADSVARAAVEEGGEGVDEGVGEGVGEGEGEGDGEGSSEGGDDAVAVRVDNQACKHRRRRYRRSARLGTTATRTRARNGSEGLLDGASAHLCDSAW